MKARNAWLLVVGAVASLVLISALIRVTFCAKDIAEMLPDAAFVAVQEAPEGATESLSAFAVLDSAPVPARPETTWREIARWTGTGPRQTQRFETSSAEWRIAWRTFWGGPSGGGCFSVYVYTDAGAFVSLAANTVGARSALSGVTASPGTFFLDVTAFCQEWEMVVEEPVVQLGLCETDSPAG